MKVILDFNELKTCREFFELQPSRGILIFTLINVAIFCSALGLSSVLEIDEVVKAKAILRPAGSISSLRSISSGQIKNKTYVHDMFILKGDPLWEIDVQSDRLDLENSKKLLAQLRQDEEDMNGLLKTVTMDSNTAAIINSQAWIMGEAWIGEQKKLKQQAEQIRVRLEREKAIPENMTTTQKISDLSSELEYAYTEISNSRSRQLLYCTDNIKNLRQNIQTIERRISDLTRKIQDTTVIAPISGRIDEIKMVNVGDYVIAGEEILRIIPQEDDSIKSILQIDPSDIARIQSGQKVYLRFPALPPSDFGQLEAIISIVPADISLGESNKYVFLVEAKLAKTTLTAPNGERIQLRSGMAAQARIKLSRKTVLQMILNKLDFIGKP